VKTAIVAMLLMTATVALIDITPAAAGWCIEGCGLKRVLRPPPRTTSVVCTSQSYGGRRETVCTRN
jgi:hypothetical protein